MNDLKIYTWVTIFQGKPCSYRLREYTLEWAKIRKTEYCPACNKKLNIGDEFYLTINNHKLFPNCLIHADCISKIDSVGLKWMDFDKVTEGLCINYQASKDFRSLYNKTFRPWGVKI